MLVTGITGRVGANVAQDLLDQGHEVRGFVWPGDRQSEKLEAIGAEIVEGDLASFEDVARAAEGMEVILNLGALSGPRITCGSVAKTSKTTSSRTKVEVGLSATAWTTRELPSQASMPQ